MKLYCVIDDIRYEIVEGATFAEEYNETLDSGSIILDQVEKIEGLEPYDDVFIYDVETNGQRFYKHMLVDKFSEELNNLNYIKLYKYKIQLFSETKRLDKVILPNISITQPVDKTKRRSVWEYLNVYLELYSPKIKILKDTDSWSYQNKYNLSSNIVTNLPETYEEVEYLESDGNQWIRTNIHIQQGDEIEIKFKDFSSGYVCGQNDQSANKYFQILHPNIIYTNQIDFVDYSFGINKRFLFTNVPSNFSGSFGLFSVTYTGDPLTDPDGQRVGNGKIYYLRHYRNSELTVNLVPCKRKSDDVLGFYDTINETFYTNMGTGTFKYKKVYQSPYNHLSIRAKFSDVDAPEMSLTNPTLRDVISQLMLTKDCIPVVHDDIIDYIDVSQRNGKFSTDHKYVNFIHSGMTSEEYSLEARREYSGALSQENTCKMVEYLGFRNSSNSLLTLENLVLETRFPIYKINKIILCYYKKVGIVTPDEIQDTNYFLCKYDITDLVLQSVVRQAMSQDYLQFESDLNNNRINSTKDLSKYKIGTVEYNIGSNKITGWGEKYSFYPDTLKWFKKERTILQNMISFLSRDAENYWGIKGVSSAVGGGDIANTIELDPMGAIETDGVYNNASNKQKSVFFEVEYDAMFGGAVVHSKDYQVKDDLTTADNCSSSLTVLEADGLFEKEKMNRLGNRQYNIQARYEDENAYAIMNGPIPTEDTDPPGCNHILGAVLEENDIKDVVIYHKEYQIYENHIQANFTGTYDYVLKNYFTSVYAKLRTYNLASYDESVVRAENYKEYVILSEDTATYETSTILYPHIEKYVSCFDLTEKPVYINNENHDKQINFAYIQSNVDGNATDQNNSRSFSDVNTFASGASLCVNLKMYDNVTNGVYIKNAKVQADDDDSYLIGSTQEWSIAVNDVEDAFQEKMIFGFGHLFKTGDIIDSGKTVIIPEQWWQVQTTDRIGTAYTTKLLKFPYFNGNDYLSNNVKYYISSGSNNNHIIYKDNKEVIDYTFQFETITNSENIVFSQYFVKLSDMSGVYNKWKETDLIENSNTSGVVGECTISYTLSTYVIPIPPSETVYGNIKIGIPKSVTLDNFPYSLSSASDFAYVSYAITIMGFGNLIWYDPQMITAKNNNTLKVNVSFNSMQVWYNTISHVYNKLSEPEFTNINVDFDYDSEDDEYVYYKYDISHTANWSNITIHDPNNVNSQTTHLILKEQTPKQYVSTQYISKNVFAIVSSEKIKKEIIYDTYQTTFNKLLFETNHQYHLATMPTGSSYEDWEFKVNFVDKNGGWLDDHGDRQPYVGIVIDLIAAWFVTSWGDPDLGINRGVQLAYDHHGSFANDAYSYLTFLGGDDLETSQFQSYLSQCLGIKQTNLSGINILNLPSNMKVINTDDKLGYYDLNYIDFNELFSFDKTGIPTIHVGSEKLDNYVNDDFPVIRSIQFWYLDNKNNVYNGQKDYGPGRLHFVFGVNVEPGQYEKDVYVSVATKRSPYVFSEDHKHIVANIKSMDADNYEQNNLISITGVWTYLNTPYVAEDDILNVNFTCNFNFYTEIHIRNGNIYYSNGTDELLVYSNNAWVNPLYKTLYLVEADEYDPDFVVWYQKSSIQPFTIENNYSGTNVVSLAYVNDDELVDYSLPILEYSKDRLHWYSYTIGNGISLLLNEKVYFRGNNQSFSKENNYINVQASENINANGNIMSLVDKKNELVIMTNQQTYLFTKLFKGCDELKNVENLNLLATTLKASCYEEMFANCSNLLNTPSFSTTVLADGCYKGMFANCISLTVPCELSVTTLAAHCYEEMFIGCANLSVCPELPSRTGDLAEFCYARMFMNCDLIERVPRLYSRILPESCYESMFENCDNIYLSSSQTELEETFRIPYAGYIESDSAHSTRDMFKNTSGSFAGTPQTQHTYYYEPKPTVFKVENAYNGLNRIRFVETGSMSTRPVLQYSSDNVNWSSYTLGTYLNIPSGGSVYFKGNNTTFYDDENNYVRFEAEQDFNIRGYIISLLTGTITSPASLPNNNCLAGLFENCTKLISANHLEFPDINITLGLGCYKNMFKGCANLVNCPRLMAKTLAESCYESMFENCTSLVTLPILRQALTLGTSCYKNMFKGCVNVVDASSYIIVYAMMPHSCEGMFENCTSLVSAPYLSSTLNDYCYKNIFRNCVNLININPLSATTLAPHCYEQMFQGCASLNIVPELNATTLADYCYAGMFEGCTSITNSAILRSTTLATGCYKNMFSGCTSLVSMSSLPALTLEESCYENMFNGCTNLKLSETQVDNYQYAYRIPTDGTGITATSALNNMFANTGGTFTGTPSINTVYYTDHELMETPFNVINNYNGMNRIRFVVNGDRNLNGLEYSFDNEVWQSYTVGSYVVLAQENSRIYFRNSDTAFSRDSSGYISFEAEQNVSVAGNLLSLINYATTVPSGCFIRMFRDCTTLINANELIIYAKALAYGSVQCFAEMFRRCTNLVTAPDIIIDEMSQSCCSQMFSGCTSLINAPRIAAKTLATFCYMFMFEDCTSLVTPARMEATTLGTRSCYYMYYGCTNLEKLPSLPVTTLEVGCYSSMFSGCTSIKLSTVQTGEYQNAYRIPATGTGTAPAGANGPFDGMFNNTGGDFTGTPEINVTYYTSNDII